VALVLAAGIPGTASAAAYLKLGDIKGEVADAAHKEQIEVISYQMGGSQASELGAVSQSASVDSRKRQHGWVTITKAVDKSSPQLKRGSTEGTVYPTASLFVPNTAGGGAAYLEYKLENVMVTSFSTGGSEGNPTETMTLNYEKITPEYKPKGRESPTRAAKAKDPKAADS
jgi:type VI secretion system secreted protein Hcp